jgi:hypothetical protein
MIIGMINAHSIPRRMAHQRPRPDSYRGSPLLVTGRTVPYSSVGLHGLGAATRKAASLCKASSAFRRTDSMPLTAAGLLVALSDRDDLTW